MSALFESASANSLASLSVGEPLTGPSLDMRQLEAALRKKCATIIELSQAEPYLHSPQKDEDYATNLHELYETETYFENRLAYLEFCGYSTEKLWKLVAELDTLIHVYQKAFSKAEVR